MNIAIYIGSIVGALVVMGGVYYLIRKYSSVYLIICSIGAGVAAANIIIGRELGIQMSIVCVIACGLVAGVLAIPALLLSDIETLEEEVNELKGTNET